jgi:hypothetical protein
MLDTDCERKYSLRWRALEASMAPSAVVGLDAEPADSSLADTGNEARYCSGSDDAVA